MIVIQPSHGSGKECLSVGKIVAGERIMEREGRCAIM